MSEMGRPKIDIDWEEFEKLCAIQCTEEEIANWFNCHIDTINNRCKENYDCTFSDIYKKKSVGGKISVRRNQFNLSKTNSTMAIWLGKQYLNQKDNVLNISDEQKDLNIHFEVVDKNVKTTDS